MRAKAEAVCTGQKQTASGVLVKIFDIANIIATLYHVMVLTISMKHTRFGTIISGVLTRFGTIVSGVLTRFGTIVSGVLTRFFVGARIARP